MHLNPPPLPVRIRFPSSSKQTIEFLLTPPENKLEKYTHSSSSSGHRVRPFSLFSHSRSQSFRSRDLKQNKKIYRQQMETFFSVSRFFLKVKMRIPKKTQLGWLYIERHLDHWTPHQSSPLEKEQPSHLKEKLSTESTDLLHSPPPHTKKV